jgi:hypothetical protein
MKIKIVKIPVGSDPLVVEIDNSLDEMKAIVGGWIEIVSLGGGLDLCCNEEGKLMGLPPNVSLFGGQDIVAGDCFLLRHDDEGEAVSVTATDIKKYVGHGRITSL